MLNLHMKTLGVRWSPMRVNAPSRNLKNWQLHLFEALTQLTTSCVLKALKATLASGGWTKKRYGDSLFGRSLLPIKLKLCYEFLWR